MRMIVFFVLSFCKPSTSFVLPRKLTMSFVLTTWNILREHKRSIFYNIKFENS